MATPLKTYFPMLRSREELLEEIEKTANLQYMFQNWTDLQQEEFLDFCTGVRGAKMLYDSFFKEILNPETTPERLEDFLSLLLKTEVRILDVLPNDTIRIADENSLLVTDIIVELKNHSIVNVEIQKIGYRFPGQRAACYSSDMLLRQYKRVRSERKKKFTYKDIQTVYTIVLFEHSPRVFQWFPNEYLHFFQQTSNTGLKMELLQKYLFIPLDIFDQNQYNKDITSKLDAWLVFLSMEDPEMIIRLITAYPEFKPLYEQMYYLCQNVERIMGMFSEELRELDRNTVQFMIDEMQETIDKQQVQHEEDQRMIAELTSQYQEAIQYIAQLKQQHVAGGDE